MRTKATTEPLSRRGAPGRMEVRRLRTGVLRIEASLGLDTQTVVRFSEAISGQRWRHCRRYDLEEVATELSQIARRRRFEEDAEVRPG